MKARKKFLIVKLSAIGDVIHALPTAHALKMGFPGCKITWVVEKPAYELVKANSYIDEVIVFDKPKCKTWGGMRQYVPQFVAQLRRQNFDMSLDLQGLFKSAIISLLSGASERLVYCNARELSDWMGKKMCGPNQHGHIVEQYLDVVRGLGVATGEVDFGLTIPDDIARQAGAIAALAGLDMTQRYVVLVPGANWSNKRWPIEHFAQLSDKLFNNKLIPVLIGGPADITLAERICQSAAIPPIDLTGKTSLLQLAYLIHHSSLVIGGDTGPVHLAAGLNKSIVMLMGPTDPNRNGPYGKNHVVLTVPFACAGCWKRECPQQQECLEAITPAVVYQASSDLLRELAL